jgi:hypothetical protein
MAIYQQVPTYYSVTWTLASPTDYSVSGGISPLNSLQYLNTIALTNTVSSPTLANNDAILLNGAVIGPFTNTDTVANMVTKFNAQVQYTGVIASINFAGYITLQVVNTSFKQITLSNSVGTPLTTLGFPVGSYGYAGPVYGGNFTSLTNGDVAVINGVTITFTTAGGLNLAGAITTINNATSQTGVVATQYTNKIQLNSISGAPIDFGSSTAGTKLGFASATLYGGAMTPASALLIEQANVRWTGIISTVQSSLTTTMFSTTGLTGVTTDGSAVPTTVTWIIGVDNPDYVYTTTLATDPEGAGIIITGTTALTRLIARALTLSWSENRKVVNNIVVQDNVDAVRQSAVNITHVVAGPLDTAANIVTIQNNLSVVQL